MHIRFKRFSQLRIGRREDEGVSVWMGTDTPSVVTSWQQQVDVAIEKDKDPSSPDMR
jgi:hypothetical protein